MKNGFLESPNGWFCVVIFCCGFFFVAEKSYAQTPSATPKPSVPTTQPTPRTKSESTSERRFFKNILHDQAAIWTSPFSLHGADARWLVPFGVGTALSFATDRRTAAEVDSSGTLQPVSRGISHFGSPYWTSGIAATFYLIGRTRHDARARETGLLAAEALIDGGAVVESLKFATQRPRPLDDKYHRGFFSGGYAFPSGHAMSAWAVSTVIAYEYGERRPLVRAGAYSFATLVALSRFGGRRHFVSDSLVGSAIGYGIGRYVFFKHHDRRLDSDEGSGDFKNASALWPQPTPYFGHDHKGLRQYGLTLTWNF